MHSSYYFYERGNTNRMLQGKQLEDMGWEQRVIRNAWREFRAFKRTALRKGKGRLWKDSGRIHFYCTVMDYFRYCDCDTEDKQGWRILRKLKQPIQAMWDCYLKHGYLEYNTWQGIEEILKKLEDGCNTPAWERETA